MRDVGRSKFFLTKIRASIEKRDEIPRISYASFREETFNGVFLSCFLAFRDKKIGDI